MLFEKKVTAFNQRVTLGESNITTKIVPPLEEPNREIGRFHGMMKVE
jgi:hypothetical protein